MKEPSTIDTQPTIWLVLTLAQTLTQRMDGTLSVDLDVITGAYFVLRLRPASAS